MPMDGEKVTGLEKIGTKANQVQQPNIKAAGARSFETELEISEKFCQSYKKAPLHKLRVIGKHLNNSPQSNKKGVQNLQ